MEVLKDFILRYARVYMAFDARFVDKEITGTEGVEIAMTALTELPSTFMNFKAAAAAAASIKDAEKGQLIEDIREAFDIESDKAKEIAIAGIDFVLASYRLQRAIVS